MRTTTSAAMDRTPGVVAGVPMAVEVMAVDNNRPAVDAGADPEDYADFEEPVVV